jgi:hypothetical protein
MQYRQYLADDHEVFYADPSPIGLGACAYLHNYHLEQDDEPYCGRSRLPRPSRPLGSR